MNQASILATGLVTSVGLSAPASCAAFRAKISNPSTTRFIDSDGEWIMAHEVLLEQPWRGLAKQARMVSMALSEALGGVPRERWPGIPLLLCVAEGDRPGRLTGLDDELFPAVESQLASRFHPSSAIFAHGRVSMAVALSHAIKLLESPGIDLVVIAAVDSLLNGPTLLAYEKRSRLLTSHNANGFMPGEGAGAMLVGKTGEPHALSVRGTGFGTEAAHVEADQPLRADGLCAAIRDAVRSAEMQMHDLAFRISDLSGEQYYFKEASLALTRLMRPGPNQFDMWHPAECIGETGALAGVALAALANAACRKGFAPGPAILLHMSNDNGARAAVALGGRLGS